MAATPLTVGKSVPRTNAPPPKQYIPDTLRGTGACTVLSTKFATGTVVTPVSNFGISYKNAAYGFYDGRPRVVAIGLRSAIITASNAAIARHGSKAALVKEVS